ELYQNNVIPCMERFGKEFGGPVFHSCGNWTKKLSTVKKIKELTMVDGAFAAETDPDPNQPGPFGAELANTGIVLNARIVGDADTVVEEVKKIWQPGLKLIVVTYCATSAEQEQVYHRIHETCQNK
ncbi:MAG: hypothetical protein SCK28_15325, partial [Bacillota bacterium]|nr:hypothetical protein [Bacillota bacterium]